MRPWNFSGSGRSDLVSRRMLSDLDRQLAGFGAEHHALGADQVADVPFLETFVVNALGQVVALQEQLDAAGHVLQLGETGLAHDALRHHATGDRYPHLHLFELFGTLVAVFHVQALRQRIAAKIVRERAALRAQRGQFFAPLRDQLVFVFSTRGHGFIVHGMVMCFALIDQSGYYPITGLTSDWPR